jgi:hypothetical protein
MHPGNCKCLKASLHNRHHNPSVGKDNGIVSLTSLIFLKRNQPMPDGLRLELTRHELQ